MHGGFTLCQLRRKLKGEMKGIGSSKENKN